MQNCDLLEGIPSFEIHLLIDNSYVNRFNFSDTARKISSLNLLEGYIELLSEGSPQRLTSILSSNEGYNKLCISLASCAAIHTDLAVLNQHAARSKFVIFCFSRFYLCLLKYLQVRDFQFSRL